MQLFHSLYPLEPHNHSLNECDVTTSENHCPFQRIVDFLGCDPGVPGSEVVWIGFPERVQTAPSRPITPQAVLRDTDLRGSMLQIWRRRSGVKCLIGGDSGLANRKRSATRRSRAPEWMESMTYSAVACEMGLASGVFGILSV